MTDNLPQTGSDVAEQGFSTAAEAINQGKTVQAIQTPYATAVAVQKPRNLKGPMNYFLYNGLSRFC